MADQKYMYLKRRVSAIGLGVTIITLEKTWRLAVFGRLRYMFS